VPAAHDDIVIGGIEQLRLVVFLIGNGFCFGRELSLLTG
jgi:hypothetical protein